MRILAYEFITGGGLAGRNIPDRLQREGQAMLSSLVYDLLDLEGIKVLTARDSRLTTPAWSAETVRALPGEDSLAHFSRAAQEADAVWPIAPETGGALESLTSLIVSGGRVLLGSRLDAVRITASKWRTAERLVDAGIPVVPTYQDAARIPHKPGNWVVKPDDGAGCCATFRLRDAAAARAWLRADSRRRFVAQPWVEGEALSLSLLCHDGVACVLSCNRQNLRQDCGRLVLQDVSVGIRTIDAELEEIALCTARALPGLWGYVGIDLVRCAAAGPVVIEINPRLTCSYCALRPRLGINVAEAVLRLLDGAIRNPPPSNSGIAPAKRSAQNPGSTFHVA